MLSDEDNFTISHLLKNGNASVASIQQQYWNKNRNLMIAGIELTPRCNFQCVHCYLQSKSRNLESLLNAESFCKIIDKLHSQGVLILYFTGGEIFSYPDFETVYLYAKKLGFIVELLSNGSLLTENHIALFNEYPPATISISMYGATPESYEKVTGNKYGYSMFCNAIDMLCKNKINTEIKFIGMRENINDFEAVKKFAEERSLSFKCNFELFPNFYGEDISKHALTSEEIIQIEKANFDLAHKWNENIRYDNPYSNLSPNNYPLYSCNFASTLALIDYKGYINPCNKMRLKDFNLLDDGISVQAIWDSFGKYREKKAPANYKCAKCNKIHICNPCPAINLLTTGCEYIPSEENCKLSKLRQEEFSKSDYS